MIYRAHGKSVLAIIVALGIALLCLLISVASPLPAGETACALTSDDIAFTVEVGLFDSGSGIWTPVSNTAQNSRQLYFRFKFNDPSFDPGNFSFKYVIGDRTVIDGISPDSQLDWNAPSSLIPRQDNMDTTDDNHDGIPDYYYWTYSAPSADTYIRFMGENRQILPNGSEEVDRYAFTPLRLYYDTSGTDCIITGITAEYANGSVWYPYSTVEGNQGNIWVSSKLRFTLSSQNIELGNTAVAEKFYYSIDGLPVADTDKIWYPMNRNVCEITNKNLNGPIQFKITDAGGKSVSYYAETEGGNAIYAKMDTVLPQFTVSATSTRLENDETVLFSYTSGLWSYNDIQYYLYPTQTGESAVTYRYSIEGRDEWFGMSSGIDGDGQIYYTVKFTRTTRNINFKATNQANLEYKAPSPYSALVDTLQPMVYIYATDVPADSAHYSATRIVSFPQFGSTQQLHWTNPDNSTVPYYSSTYTYSGDATYTYFHLTAEPDSYLLIKASDGYLHYAKNVSGRPVDSGVRVGASEAAVNAVTKMRYNDIDFDKYPDLVSGLPAGDFRIGYASDSLIITLYNRDVNGNRIENQSSIACTYKYVLSYDPITGEPVYSEVVSAVKSFVAATGEVYYNIVVEPFAGRRTYVFRMVSESGLAHEREFTVATVSGKFEIAIDPMGDRATSVWANAPVEVYVNVPIADKYEFVYGISGTGYETFTYSVLWSKYGARDDDSKVMDVTSLFANRDPTDPQYVDMKTHMKFRIYLNTSVERRTFEIYVKNAAGVESTNRIQTKELKLDIVKPQVSVDAKVQDSDVTLLSFKSGDYEDVYANMTDVQSANCWSNGNIVLTLDARGSLLSAAEMSLSGMTCELMQTYGVPEVEILPERDNAGLSVNRFVYLIEIPEAVIAAGGDAANVYEEILLFRIVSGSGLESYFTYHAKIDKRTVELNSATYDDPFEGDDDLSGGVTVSTELLVKGTESEFVDVLKKTYTQKLPDGSTVVTYVNQTVCTDITVTANSNQAGHSSMYYQTDPAQEFRKSDGMSFTVAIPAGGKGVISVKMRVESYARDKDGNKARSRDYELRIPYDTLQVTIAASTPEGVSGEYREDGAGWRNGPIVFTVTFPELAGNPDFDYADYTYGLLLLGDMTDTEYMAAHNIDMEFISSRIYKYVTPFNIDPDGTFRFYGVDENGVPWINKDPTNPEYSQNFCTYNGGLLIYAFNAAKYASNNVPYTKEKIKVDNSTPVALDLLGSLNGELYYNAELRENIIYNNEVIVLTAPDYQFRAQVSFFYWQTDTEPANYPDLSVNPMALNGWTLLPAGSSLNIDASGEDGLRYYLYAENTLGAKSSDFISYKENYIFKVDGNTAISFNINYPEGNGSSEEAVNELGETINVFAFRWTTEISIGFSNDSATPVRYMYSVDYGKSWLECFDAPVTAANSTFVYTDNINATVCFKMVNLAGTTVSGVQPAIFRIDNKQPKFTLSAEYNGKPYDGGTYGTLASPSWDDTGTWAGSAVTIVLEVAEGDENPSTVEYQYYIRSKFSTENTDRVEIPSKTFDRNPVTRALRLTFTTDRMDSFGENNDALVVVVATCTANGMSYTQGIRVKVDKVIPEFSLEGKVYADEAHTQDKIFNSGDWTNQDEVRISLTWKEYSENVSNVTTVYYIDGRDVANDWRGFYSCTKAETIRVVATSEAEGKSFEQTFEVNIDVVAPQIKSGIIVPSTTGTPNTYYIDQPIDYVEENVRYAQYITRVGMDESGGLAGFPLTHGHIIATNSVDNSEESKGYVKIIIEDWAGNKSELEFYMVPFELDINNLTLSDEHMARLDMYEEHLALATGIDESRRAYFENLIARLRDRETTLRQEIAGFQSYLASLTQKVSYELRSDYNEMFSYINTYDDYAYFDQAWIQQAIVEGEYAAYYEKLQTVFRSLQKQMDKVSLVEKNTRALPAINVVEAGDYNQVLQVYDSYTDLLSDEKACFTTTLYNKLISLKRSCENMLLQDSASGVVITGNLAPGAQIEVVSYANTVELFENAQATILSSIDSEEPRTAIAIYKVSLTGAASQTSTGAIEVALPIPEAYYNYVRFAVYRLSSDGTVSKVAGTHIEGDGKSVTFSANGLDTFILCARANIAVKEENTDSYGTIAGIEIDYKLITYVATAVIGIFGILIVVVIIVGLRRKRFLNHYNREHRSSLYRKGIQNIPKGNAGPRKNPYKDDRVRTPNRPR